MLRRSNATIVWEYVTLGLSDGGKQLLAEKAASLAVAVKPRGNAPAGVEVESPPFSLLLEYPVAYGDKVEKR